MSKYNRAFKLAIAKQCLYYSMQVLPFHGENSFIKRQTTRSFEDKYRILKTMHVNL